MQDKKQKLNWLLIALVLIGTASCKKEFKDESPTKINEDNIETSSVRTVENIPYRQSQVVLGEPKQNPYTVVNMQQAFATIARQGFSSEINTTISTTHYYVKFKPQNIDQYELLKRDSTISTQDLPIESTIIQNGNKYHDPSLPNDVPTYQYTAVPKEYKFAKGIPYEILDNLYIPEEDASVNTESNSIYFNKLLDQAYIQTGNFEDTIKNNNYTEARYRPGGRLQTFDTRLNRLIGAEGVRMEARRWFVVYSAYTNENGDYRMAWRFNRPCNYSAWFANPFFAVREHLFGLTSWINGPKQEGDWNHNIMDGYDRFVSHVYRGAIRYNFKNVGGLQRPWILPVTGGRQIYIAVDGTGNQQGINWMVLPIIKVWRFLEADVEFQSDEIFSTTCHETAHTSHVLRMNAGLIQYWQVSSQLQESWCIAIEWFLSNIEYRERGIVNYGRFDYLPLNPPGFPNSYGYQFWNGNDWGFQNSSIYIDIVDDHNQLGINYPFVGTGTVDDRVQDYTLPFIETFMLRHIYGHKSLMEELKAHRPASVTDAQIDLLISNF